MCIYLNQEQWHSWLLTKVCNDVQIEPNLQPVTLKQLQMAGATPNSQEGPRFALSTNRVWGRSYEKTFFDVRVLNPHASSNKRVPLPACYRKHEREKNVPIIIGYVRWSTPHSHVLSATNFYKHLTSMLALKWDSPYNSTLCCPGNLFALGYSFTGISRSC